MRLTSKTVVGSFWLTRLGAWPGPSCNDPPVEDLVDFVLSQLGRTPSRVLEVGCGEGRAALALAAAGHDVTAIDPVAPDGSIFQRVTLEEFAAADPFDAVVASRSLHHVPDLDFALEKIARLAPLLIVEEFAWDRLDERTASWYLAHLTGTPTTLEKCLRDWADEHAGLHGYEALRAALDHRFRERVFAWHPFLHRLHKVHATEKNEQAAIDARAINPLSFRYVGDRRGHVR